MNEGLQDSDEAYANIFEEENRLSKSSLFKFFKNNKYYFSTCCSKEVEFLEKNKKIISKCWKSSEKITKNRCYTSRPLEK